MASDLREAEYVSSESSGRVLTGDESPRRSHSSSPHSSPHSPRVSEDEAASEVAVEALHRPAPKVEKETVPLLNRVCEIITNFLKAIGYLVKSVWNAIFGAADASAAQPKERSTAPFHPQNGFIPPALFKLYREDVAGAAIEPEALAAWKAELTYLITTGQPQLFSDIVTHLFNQDLNDAAVVSQVETVKQEIGEALTPVLRDALDQALNANRWLRFLRWEHSGEGTAAWSAEIHNVQSDGACLLHAARWGLAPLTPPQERTTEVVLRNLMFTESLDTRLENQGHSGQEFRRHWLQAILTFEPAPGEEPYPAELLRHQQWEREMFCLHGLRLAHDDELCQAGAQSQRELYEAEISAADLATFKAKLGRLVAAYKTNQLNPTRWNGDLELALLPPVTHRALIIFRRDQHTNWQGDDLDILYGGGNETITLTQTSEMRIEPLAIHGAGFLPQFDDFLRDEVPAGVNHPLYVFNPDGPHYMGMRYQAQRA